MNAFIPCCYFRYGTDHPLFFIGSFEDALKESLHCKAKDVRTSCSDFNSTLSTLNLFVCLQRRLLAIYLHHDGSILSNVFCSQILCADAVVSYLSNHFVLWAWDVTLPKNKAK